MPPSLPPQSPRRFAVLDVHFLIALIWEVDGPRGGLLDSLRTLNIDTLIPSAVVEELQQAEIVSSDLELRETAAGVLRNLAVWGMLAWELTLEQSEQADRLAECIEQTGRVDLTPNAVRILAETAVLGCEYLITDRAEFVDLASNSLTLNGCIHEMGLTPFQIVPSMDGHGD